LVADIGGTNARFALVEFIPQTSIEIMAVHKLACADYPSLPVAIRHYYEQVDVEPSAVRQATVAVAGPVDGDWFEMTNNPWAFSIRAVQQELGFKHFYAINDFTAVAWAITRVGAGDYAPIGGGSPDAGTPIGIIGPGTGLGMGGLIPCGGGWNTLHSEGGHSNFAPTNDLEVEIFKVLLHKYGRVSNERILSGPGLEDLYQAIAQIEGHTVEHRSAAHITSAAVDSEDPLSVTTLSNFCAVLGSLAGDLALILGARAGVYIGGGIVPRFIEFLKQSPFRKRFEAKGRFYAYNAAIPTRVLTHENPGLLGAAAFLLAGLESGG
jgi:glucokinase